MAFVSIWTDVGLAKLAAALAMGPRVEIIEMAIGDGGGSPTTPVASQTALVNEVERYDVNALEVRPPATTVVTIEATVPAEDGPFFIREIGLYDDDGDLVAVANCPETEKTIVGDGALTAVLLQMTLDATNPDLAITLIIDPGVVMATREYVDEWAHGAQHYAWITFR